MGPESCARPVPARSSSSTTSARSAEETTAALPRVWDQGSSLGREQRCILCYYDAARLAEGRTPHIIRGMEQSTKALVALTLGCTFAAALFGFGAEVFSYRSAYDELGREPLIQATRLFVYVALGVLLVFRGGWTGVLAAIVMALAAASLEWALFPFAYGWATIEDPAGYAERFGGVNRPPYSVWVTYDVLGVGISAALAQGLRTMTQANPRGL